MKRFGFVSLFVVLAAAAFAFYVQSSKLYINGELASSGIIERNGVAYVPLKDVAASLKFTVQKTSRGYEMGEAGGANQVSGITGKVGDMLFNGFVRFQVVKVTHMKTPYRTQFDNANRDIVPLREGSEIVVVLCKIKNGTQKTVVPSYVGGLADALTDTDGHSYGPRTTSDLPPYQELLPGAGADFALIFDVPLGVKLQDLVYEPAIGIVGADKKKFRVSLGE